MMRIILFSLAGIVLIGAIGFAGWIFSLPATVAAAPAAIPADETASILSALKPPKRPRPVVAVIGLNDATETLDYLMPTGILRRADVADVILVATQEGPVQLYPSLRVEPDTTIAKFDAQFPEGADYIIVPAMSRDDDPAVMAWLKQQAAKGSIVVGVCAGAKVVAAAGLLKDRKGTTHWFYKRELSKRDPTVTLVADRRFVVDGPVATTTGISASMPFALTLIEAIAGHDKAAATAAAIGVTHWDARHDSRAFGLTRDFVTTVAANTLAFWQRDTFTIALTPGFDVVSLALTADAWSRTYRSRALTIADTAAAVPDITGIRVVPDLAGASPQPGTPVDIPSGATPAAVLDAALAAIGRRYGAPTAAEVAMQLEYPGPGSNTGA
jgi:transcriptional regulator GlxA family with amidase domain